ncbi:ATP-binding cassette domain-containing protein [Bacteroidota bacterium]
MDRFFLKGENLSKTFDSREPVFNSIKLELKNNSIIGIAGKNGSGKTTLLKIMAGLLIPTDGNVTFSIKNNVINKEGFNDYYGFVAPYLNLYEEFTDREQIKVFMELKGLRYNEDKAEKLLSEFNLSNTENKYIGKFSSGMKQRLKFILAFMHEPLILFLDEPFSNLDEFGINSTERMIANHIDDGGGVVLASNDSREKALCHEIISLD